MELQKMKFEIESLKKNKSKPSPVVPMETIKEEPVVKQEKQPIVSKIDEVDNSEPINNSVPAPIAPKPIRRNLANKGDIWNMIRNS